MILTIYAPYNYIKIMGNSLTLPTLATTSVLSEQRINIVHTIRIYQNIFAKSFSYHYQNCIYNIISLNLQMTVVYSYSGLYWTTTLNPDLVHHGITPLVWPSNEDNNGDKDNS